MWLCVSITFSQVLGRFNSKEYIERIQRDTLGTSQDKEEIAYAH